MKLRFRQQVENTTHLYPLSSAAPLSVLRKEYSPLLQEAALAGLLALFLDGLQASLGHPPGPGGWLSQYLVQ